MLLLGLTLSLGATAQTIVTGLNLNIGTNNTCGGLRGLDDYHNLLKINVLMK